MAVLINEFEVVVEPPATAPTEEAGDPNEQAQPRVLAPFEVAQLMMHGLARQLRLTAD